MFTEQLIYALTLDGYSHAQVQSFYQRVNYARMSLPLDAQPDDFKFGHWLFLKIRPARIFDHEVRQYKRSKLDSRRRRFSFLWEKIRQWLLECREDANADKIQSVLSKGPKSLSEPSLNGALAAAAVGASPTDPFGSPLSEEAVSPGDSVGTDDTAAAAAAAAQKEKASIKGKPMTEKVSTALPARAKPGTPPSPPSSVSIAVEWIDDTGAGRHLSSIKHICKHFAVTPEVVHKWSHFPSENLSFVTGGERQKGKTCLDDLL